MVAGKRQNPDRSEQPDSCDLTMHLVNAFSINDRGEITGWGVVPNGDPHAFLLVPCGQGTEGCGDAAESMTTAIQNRPAPTFHKSTIPQVPRTPNEVMAAWRARLAQRYHIPGSGTGPTN
jgi:hypothetical protein